MTLSPSRGLRTSAGFSKQLSICASVSPVGEPTKVVAEGQGGESAAAASGCYEKFHLGRPPLLGSPNFTESINFTVDRTLFTVQSAVRPGAPSLARQCITQRRDFLDFAPDITFRPYG